MKNILRSIILLTLFFSACKEQIPPGLDLGGVQSSDSTWVGSPEAPQNKNVFIEELTGVTCSNCPAAAEQIESIKQNHPGRVVSVALHAGSSFTTPIVGESQYDFRTEDGEKVLAFYGEEGNKPSASIDRKKLTTGFNIYWNDQSNSWAQSVDESLAKTTPVNIHLNSSYNEAENVATVTAQVAFTENVSDDLSLTLYVIEDSIIDAQEKFQGGQVITIHDYVFNHVFRTLITNTAAGVPLNLGDKTAGRVMQKRFTFDPKISGVNGWNLDHCHVIAFVSLSGSSKEVLHIEEVKLR